MQPVRARSGQSTGLRRTAASQAGVGLIEVLVAVLVLSIGFVGIAALQARSLSTNNSALARSMATVASYSILDAMRADLTNAVGGAYNQTVKANACPSASGSLANAQLNQWCSVDLAQLGVSGSTSGSITCTAAPGTTTAYCTVTVQFDDSRAGLASSTTQQVVTQAML
ncbi:type IV pilus modification protein PilV [Rhodanobacter sp. DHB23]|uniref:type IV pilus modification protein PilV n=1 Tax=Rhodanobacter sp. DHB23 TaxID=2775923 RepID=UPI00177DF480|nr:type IV pilus modification protein PilV [Rhodanobacter sp. DHB23]MBD8871996.1 type IV pilus modification protein PilV [Rhodanobacter sp. DHB23]